MLRYGLVILLVNIYGRSFGLPVGHQTGNGTIMIGNLLSELAKECKNEFVASLISSKLDECNLEMPPMHDSQIRCLMFYDASVVLCNLTTDSPKLATDFAVKTKTEQNVSEFCSEAANLGLPPTRFRANITEILHKTVPCTVVCTDENVIMRGVTTFYCKYYKWMLDMVHGSQHTPVVNTVANDGQKPVNNTLVTGASLSDHLPIVLPNDHEVKESSPDTNNRMTSTNTVDANLNHAESAAGSHAESAAGGPSSVPLLDQKKNISETAPETRHSSENKIGEQQQDNSDKNGDVQIENVLEGNVHGGEAPKPNSGLEGDDDQGLDDTDDQMDPEAGGDVMDENDMESKPEPSDKKPLKHDEPPLNINSESSHGDTYLNPIGEFTDDDDHFFPFFLTAVIVVVVLYVLYHNKNKVGKMFFGLIVEGRQSGRRRTSRGHAYRRLDTLEQAMSANTTAPPSKIIY